MNYTISRWRAAKSNTILIILFSEQLHLCNFGVIALLKGALTKDI